MLPDTQLDSIGTVQDLCHARKGKKLCPRPHVVDQIWKVVISRRICTVLPIPPRAKLQKPGVGSAALLRKRTPGHSPCHHYHPLPWKLLGCSTRRPSTQNTPAIPEPEDGADLEPPPHDTSLPDEAAEFHTQQLPQADPAPHRSWRVVEAAPARHRRARWARCA